MKRPLIGIVGKIMDKSLIENDFRGWTIVDVSNDINHALIKNGAATIGILPPKRQDVFTTYATMDDIELNSDDLERLDQVLEMCDGLVLEGGVTAYSYEKYVARYALENDIPFLGICSGLNITVLANGGSLKKIPGGHFYPTQPYAHALNVDKNSVFYRIVQKERMTVNSIHVNTPERIVGYDIAATTDDGLVEVIERKDKRFYFGVGFHPEMLVDNDEDANAIFQALVREASRTRSG